MFFQSRAAQSGCKCRSCTICMLAVTSACSFGLQTSPKAPSFIVHYLWQFRHGEIISEMRLLSTPPQTPLSLLWSNSHHLFLCNGNYCNHRSPNSHSPNRSPGACPELRGISQNIAERAARRMATSCVVLAGGTAILEARRPPASAYLIRRCQCISPPTSTGRGGISHFET
jgi:hypothetical protein